MSKKIVGRWRIEEMSEWDKDYIDMMEEGHFQIMKDGSGSFVFGVLYGEVDGEWTENGTSYSYSWIGSCEGDEISGRGSFRLLSPDLAEGQFSIYRGDKSKIKIRRET